MPTSFSPKLFLKARRPERFSDSVVKEATELDRSLLEYHLGSLTSRSQETDFEEFARQLCEREVCPNLLPHTGPSGGGDSKVDSETYPVADDLALAWYFGQAAAQERWAFAFSAKAAWRSKVQSDIAKIASTNRGYVKAFFVTNQAVPDRKRAQVEDALRVKHGLDVRILDRTWILDRVFHGGHESLAITHLNVTALSHRLVKKGPLDIAHEGELEEVEKRIREALQKGQPTASLVEDALDAADLARNLERPRTEIEGLYARADQLALKYGTERHQVEAAYQWAWTLFWWFEDYDAFSKQYTIVEKRVAKSRNAYDLECLSNLWYCLHGAVRRSDLEKRVGALQKRTGKLIAELGRLSGETNRPSTALQAETLLIRVQLVHQLAAKQPIGELLKQLQDVVLRSTGLVGYPFEPIVEYLSEVGHFLEDAAEYDELFSTIVEVAATRDGEISAARLLLRRGENQLNLGRPVEAIKTLGQSLGRLYKHETRREIIQALYFCGCAYDSVGLPWAARGTLLAAASVATNDLWQYGEITPYQGACYRRLKWVELRLGRLPHILAWHELDAVVRHELVNRGYDSEKLFADDYVFNVELGRLLLRTDFADLQLLQNLPDVLDQIELWVVADALLYALGHTERLEEMANKFGDDPEALAQQWWSLRADSLLPDQPLLYSEGKVLLRSQVLGCKITVESPLDPPCIEVAESFLAGLESFLATSILDGAIAREPELTVEVSISHSIDTPVSVSVQERNGRPHLVVNCQLFDPHNMTVSDQFTVREAVFKAVVTAFANSILFTDFERDIEALFRDQRVAERAVAFATSFGVQSNVLGSSPKTRLSDWIDQEAVTYTLRRTQPWEPERLSHDSEAERISVKLAQPGDPIPEEIYDPNTLSHEQIATVSLIRERLWDRAGWSGCLFITPPGYEPMLGLIFSNREAGREIFQYWQAELGKIDKQERIRLVIVRGIDKANPHAYRVCIGSNPEDIPANARLMFYVSRMCRVDAGTSANLDRFLSAYAAADFFFLAPAFVPTEIDENNPPDVEEGLHIAVHRVYVRNAWEIGLQDIDSVAITDEDNPIIPAGINNPPVLELMKSRRFD